MPFRSPPFRLRAVDAHGIDRRLEEVRDRLERALRRAGRPAGDVSILPITKGHPAEVLELLAALGFPAIGENRIGEAEAKFEAVGKVGLRWHMVGHVQRNKALRAVRLFDRIDSLDSLRLAERIDAAAEREGKGVVEVLVQVNASGEATKGGFPPEDVAAAVDRLRGLPHVDVRGLMTMAPFTTDERVLRHCFRATREALERCRAKVAAFQGGILSMGMSNDFEIAVEEGSTEVRLGTILVGERPE